jgi:hypothetical protein
MPPDPGTCELVAGQPDATLSAREVNEPLPNFGENPLKPRDYVSISDL